MRTSTRAASLAAGLAAVCLSVAVRAADVFVLGPLEQVDATSAQATVLGQRMVLSADQHEALRDADANARATGHTLYLEIVGDGAPDGVISALEIQAYDDSYVAGAHQVALVGIVQAASPESGVVTVGGLPIALAGAQQYPQAGELIEFVGTQPLAGGAALAGSYGIIGSGTKGIIGSGTKGIIGSGTKGIIGSGTKGIIGSGTKGIIGSGTKGIIGSGTKGIIGSGTKGIIGSGMR